jgi:hypothetical protein
MQKFVIGIDVSKEKLDLCLQSEEKTFKELVLPTTVSGIKKFC